MAVGGGQIPRCTDRPSPFARGMSYSSPKPDPVAGRSRIPAVFSEVIYRTDEFSGRARRTVHLGRGVHSAIAWRTADVTPGRMFLLG